MQHSSDCAVHNMPAMPAGKCDCGAKNLALNDTVLLAERHPVLIATGGETMQESPRTRRDIG